MSIAEKVVLTKEQAETLEFLKGLWRNDDPSHALETVIKEKLQGWSSESFAPLNELDTDTFLRALLIGYKTTEEQIKELYNHANEVKETDFLSSYSKGYKQGMEDALNILGIKIEGINA